MSLKSLGNGVFICNSVVRNGVFAYCKIPRSIINQLSFGVGTRPGKSQVRSISTSKIWHKKTKSEPHQHVKAGDNKDAGVEVVKFDVAALTKKFEETVQHFKTRAAEVRQGKFTPKVVEEIMVEKSAHHTGQSLVRDLALVSLKGPKTLVVTVFDPKDRKHIISSIMAANLNLNPQPDPSNDQVLRISLPPNTSETKKAISTSLKAEYEHFRNSKSHLCLTVLREQALHHFKKGKAKGLSDNQVEEYKNKIEVLFKKYSQELSNELKASEAALQRS